ncbi:hypothetical protein CgunFtcFv8_018888 [Champsocephalus gunnari]|uniref:Uncharacterized protein n=1 Tax=Champsocephalus gunnari TaxID=52237 RepID=A0AAN8DGP3_CHAGU|nr:hypothetical protein CgunFtcFv8_018888 [Champsocephalus gunnari]
MICQEERLGKEGTLLIRFQRKEGADPGPRTGRAHKEGKRREKEARSPGEEEGGRGGERGTGGGVSAGKKSEREQAEDGAMTEAPQ